MKIVINKCFGGFGLSLQAQKMYCERKGIGFYPYKRTKYKFEDGIEEYSFFDDLNQSDMSVHISNTYLGDKCESIPKGNYWYYGSIERTDKDLIYVVETLKSQANGDCSFLKVIEIPDGIEWDIGSYDGLETIYEKHRRW